jgi:hypothetical protein
MPSAFAWRTRAGPCGAAVGRRSEPLPRCRLVSQVVVTADVPEAVRRVDVATTACSTTPSTGTAARPDEPRWSRTDRDCCASAPARRLLVVSESYHSGWRARVDGTDAPVVRAYGDYLGVVVGPGTQEVALRFEPASFTRGVRISALGAGLTLLWLAVSIGRVRAFRASRR